MPEYILFTVKYTEAVLISVQMNAAGKCIWRLVRICSYEDCLIGLYARIGITDTPTYISQQ